MTDDSDPMACGIHRFPVRVYFEDTDAGGIVYHANYLRFAERARTEALRAMGLPHSEMMLRHGMIFVVRRVELDYQRPARLDDSLVIETSALSVGGASARLQQRVARGSETLAIVDVTLVSVREETGRPERIPPPWRDGLTAMAQARGDTLGAGR